MVSHCCFCPEEPVSESAGFQVYLARHAAFLDGYRSLTFEMLEATLIFRLLQIVLLLFFGNLLLFVSIDLSAIFDHEFIVSEFLLLRAKN
jgi:hypothetical protein